MKSLVSAIVFSFVLGDLSGAVPPCYRELQAEAFPYHRVVQAFDTAYVSQAQWPFIYSQLQAGKAQIPEMIRRAAAQMNPNPLNDPFQPQLAVELLQKAEYEVFFNVMNKTQFNNLDDINQMFTFIFQTHANKIYQCLGVDIIRPYQVPD